MTERRQTQQSGTLKRRLERVGWVVGALASFALIWSSLTHHGEMDITEVLGFITGAVSVWLTVKQNIWNWPIGIANSAFYVIVFFQARLFADSSLNVFYVALGFLGWYWWLKGGEHRTALNVGRVSRLSALVLAAVGLAGTAGMTVFLASIHDSAPFLDALTTVLSLIAEYMLARKLLENWGVWITADVIYIGLYTYRSLYLTAVLYVLFLTMCVVGLVSWRRTWLAARIPPGEIVMEPARA
jgi:nicotinamide mononucleotide transporter